MTKHKQWVTDYLISNLKFKAQEAIEKSYAPYSKFRVGAALLCSDGTLITAGNVEFAVSAIGMCAERLALSEAMMQKKQPTHIAVCTHYEDKINIGTSGCGLCRQAMVDFPKLKVMRSNGSFASINTLLPKAYHGRKAR